MVQLGALDFCLHPAGELRTGLGNLLELAGELDRIGYVRYWLGEHHASNALDSPEMVLGAVAGHTVSMLVGTGVTLVRYHRPIKLASIMGTLACIYPGRIELGVGRGMAPARVARRLGRPQQAGFSFERRLQLTKRYLELYDGINVGAVPAPAIWVAAASGASLCVAGRLGAFVSISLMFGRSITANSIDAYVETFQGSSPSVAPRWNIAVAGHCSSSASVANQIAARWTNPSIIPTVVGNPRVCSEQLRSIMKRYRTTEVVFLDIGRSYEERLTSYRLLSQEMLDPRQWR